MASAFIGRDAFLYIIERAHAGKGLQELLELRLSYLAPVLALAMPSHPTLPTKVTALIFSLLDLILGLNFYNL